MFLDTCCLDSGGEAGERQHLESATKKKEKRSFTCKCGKVFRNKRDDIESSAEKEVSPLRSYNIIRRRRIYTYNIY